MLIGQGKIRQPLGANLLVQLTCFHIGALQVWWLREVAVHSEITTSWWPLIPADCDTMGPKKKIPGHLWGAAALLLGGTTYSTYRYVLYHREAAEIGDDTKPSTSGRFEQLSSKYDAAVGAEETWMGIGILRRWLLGHAQVRKCVA